jgi:hypothetical protein
MPMTVVAKSWSRHKMASTSLVLCLVEFIIVLGAVVVQSPPQHTTLVRMASIAWLVGSVASIVCAVVAIIVEPRREIGLLSLIVAVAIFLVCGLQMLV